MLTLLIAIGSLLGFVVAYHTYGRWLARRVFALDPRAEVPSRQFRDDVDFVPTRKQVVFGHHFTSIAGTGPIVGPAIAVFWGWLPALLWVVLGSILIGAVHDLGALVVSLRHRGQTVGEVAGRVITPRAKVLFLLVLFFALTVVLAIFGLVIASIFRLYPESVLSVWLAMPLAVIVGYWTMKTGGSLVLPAGLALLLLYGAIYLGAEYVPFVIPASWCLSGDRLLGLAAGTLNPTVVWTVILFGYCFIAAVLPVWMLLQPRDFINSQQLIVALGLLLVGIVVASWTGQADLMASAPAVVPVAERPADAPPLWPFLFITIACGAISGFHCVVASGTTSKQVANEADAHYVAYGGMLLEAALAVMVILCCCAGVGMGCFSRQPRVQASPNWLQPYQFEEPEAGEQLTGRVAWRRKYAAQQGWKEFRLGKMVGSFVDGGANFLAALGLPLKHAVAILAVLVACFAATTLDTATRLQRYVVQELAATWGFQPLQNKYLATLFAVTLALLLALLRGPETAAGQPAPYGTGGLLLWPLFGAINQLLAGLALLVTIFYLRRCQRPIWFVVLPLLLMLGMPSWALCWQMFHADTGWWPQQNYLLVTIGALVLLLQLWMIVEAVGAWARLLPR